MTATEAFLYYAYPGIVTLMLAFGAERLFFRNSKNELEISDIPDRNKLSQWTDTQSLISEIREEIRLATTRISGSVLLSCGVIAGAIYWF